MKKINLLAIACAISTFFFISGAFQFSKFELKTYEGDSRQNVSSTAEKTPDLSSLTWEEAASSAPWSERDAHASIVFNDKIWLMGGLNGNPVAKGKYVEYWNAPYFNDIWSTANGTDWTREAATSTWHPRRSLSLQEFNGKIWLIGGWSPIDGYNTDIFTSPDGAEWSLATTSARWSNREGQVVRAFNNKLWLFGGVNYDERKTFNDVWSSEDGIHWMEVASSSPWSGRWDHDVVIYKNKMWLMGGMHLDGSGEKDVWATENGVDWTLMTNDAPWGPRQGHEVVQYKEKMWVIGGWDLISDIGSQTTWWSDDGALWQKTTLDNPWVGREDHATVIFNDKIWVIGGMNTGFKWSNDVWYSTLGEPEKKNNTNQQARESNISAKSFISEAADAEGNIRVVAEKNSGAQLPIASISKLMASIVAVNNYDLAEKIAVPQETAGTNGSSKKLEAGEIFFIGDLLYPLLIESDNDAGVALASKMGEKKFVELMNQEAVSLGLTGTHFVNPVGLDPDNNTEPNYSTARDLAKLALVIIRQYPHILNIMSLKEYDLKTASGTLHHTLTTTNKLLGKNLPLNIVGGKTGETPRAKKNLLLIARGVDENSYIISVVLGSDDNFGDMKKLLISSASK